MEDEEKMLMMRDSAKHKERILNIKIREQTYLEKIEGYNRLETDDETITEVFIGYIAGLKAEHRVEILSEFANVVAEGQVLPRLSRILTKRLTTKVEILNALSSS